MRCIVVSILLVNVPEIKARFRNYYWCATLFSAQWRVSLQELDYEYQYVLACAVGCRAPPFDFSNKETYDWPRRKRTLSAQSLNNFKTIVEHASRDASVVVIYFFSERRAFTIVHVNSMPILVYRSALMNVALFFHIVGVMELVDVLRPRYRFCIVLMVVPTKRSWFLRKFSFPFTPFSVLFTALLT